MLHKKVAIVTGSSKGIGKAIAGILANQGFSVVMNGTQAEQAVKECVEELQSQGGEVCYIQGDISRTEDRKNLLEYVIKRFGRIDVLVNNAGVSPIQRLDILETTEENVDYVLDVNLKGTFFLTQAVAKIMLQQGKSAVPESHLTIINISSISAEVLSIDRGEYCIAKAGVSMITKLFAYRLAESGIRVYEIRPGLIDTAMTRPAHDKYTDLIESGLTPIRRWGVAADVAKAVRMLCDDNLSFSTGEVIHVDGGLHLRKL